MKVAVVTSFPANPEAPHGGVEAVSVNLVEALAEFDDLDIDVVTTRQNSDSQGIQNYGKVRVHRLAWAGGSMLRNATGPGRRQMQEYLRKLNPDVIHAHDTYGLMVKGTALPRVFTIHGFIYGDVMVSGTRFASLRSKLWRHVETSGWADQSHIISISPYVRERLDGISKGEIYDIDNPVGRTFFTINRNEREGTIFCAAALIPRKNTLALVDAIAELVAGGLNVELRLAGSLENKNHVAKMQERVKENGLEKNVLLLGSLSSEQIREELSSASVFGLVSLEENSPMGIEEAMAAGVPVVTSNRCGMPYMVQDCESGFLVDPLNPSDIATRLKRLLENNDLRKAFGAKGKEIALARFHPEKVAKRTREVYLRAIEDFKAG
jgi:glycosyltransferase involved in cell wall biosynthesis